MASLTELRGVGFSLVAVAETVWKTAAVVSTRGSPRHHVH